MVTESKVRKVRKTTASGPGKELSLEELPPVGFREGVLMYLPESIDALSIEG